MQEIRTINYVDKTILMTIDNQGNDMEVCLPINEKETLMKDQCGQVYLVKALPKEPNG